MAVPLLALHSEAESLQERTNPVTNMTASATSVAMIPVTFCEVVGLVNFLFCTGPVALSSL